MVRTAEARIVGVTCSKCNKFLAGVPAGSFVYCPRCSLWVEAGGDDDKQTVKKSKG